MHENIRLTYINYAQDNKIKVEPSLKEDAHVQAARIMNNIDLMGVEYEHHHHD